MLVLSHQRDVFRSDFHQRFVFRLVSAICLALAFISAMFLHAPELVCDLLVVYGITPIIVLKVGKIRVSLNCRT